jgi:tetraacyldisaccharide 4'-kinase
MKPPGFWQTGGPVSIMLAPVGWAWAAGAAWRAGHTRPERAPLPVVCVGNLVVGGAGKTPVAKSIARRLSGANFLSRGYGGRLAGPVLVDLQRHDHLDVGDEPLLLAGVAPCWVARDRVAGARAAAAKGAKCLVMDDGFQDPSLVKDVSIVVVDGHVGFGSGRCIPAGPLRETLKRGLGRADAVVILGEDRAGVAAKVGELPILHGVLEPESESASLAGREIVAFAGIGRPKKFFHLLESRGAQVIETHAFPDHHIYTPEEIGHLITLASSKSAMLMTTTKDFVRLPAHQRNAVSVLRVSVNWQDEAALMRLLDSVQRRAA